MKNPDQDSKQIAKPEETEADTPKLSWKQRLWREWIRPLGLTLLVFMSFRSAVADWNDVPTGSMKPTILEGDRIFVNKVAYDLKIPFTKVRLARWGEPEAGDVVVLDSPADGLRLVKRVVGIPGDRLSMQSGRLYRNGVQVVMTPAEREDADHWKEEVLGQAQFHWENIGEHRHPIMIQPRPGPIGRDFEEIVVPEDHFFVMGDNRTNSTDSRVFGFVDKALIVGRAFGIAGSWNSNESRFRWDRFFSDLP